MGNDQDFLFKNECYKIVGACMEVHKVLGVDFWNLFIRKRLL